jgi:hypothetical protein
MPLTLPVETTDVIGLDELVDHVRAKVDLDDHDSICEAAPKLAALANDKAFLGRWLAEQLRCPERFQPDSAYYSRAFVLARGPRFMVRATMWLPDEVPELPLVDNDDERIAGLTNSMYGVVHNHTFSFLTVGYFGPGYDTDTFEVDPERIDVEAPVDLRPLGRTTLQVGKMMYYRAKIDVHNQIPPPSLSIALNLLVMSEDESAEQFYFDLGSRKVAAVVGARNAARCTICDLAGAVGDEETRELLARAGARSVSPRVQAAARRSAEAIDLRLGSAQEAKRAGQPRS